MMNLLTCVETCTVTCVDSNAIQGNNLAIWVPSIISIITLLFNLGFYIFCELRLGYKYRIKQELAKISAELLTYLAEIVSYDTFEGVPTQIRNYSLKIHLCFKTGTADEEIAEELEQIFQAVKCRKKLTDASEIGEWNEKFRKKVRKLRCLLSKYCGAL